jgi:hypothetical protein
MIRIETIVLTEIVIMITEITAVVISDAMIMETEVSKEIKMITVMTITIAVMIKIVIIMITKIIMIRVTIIEINMIETTLIVVMIIIKSGNILKLCIIFLIFKLIYCNKQLYRMVKKKFGIKFYYQTSKMSKKMKFLN